MIEDNTRHTTLTEMTNDLFLYSQRGPRSLFELEWIRWPIYRWYVGTNLLLMNVAMTSLSDLGEMVMRSAVFFSSHGSASTPSRKLAPPFGRTSHSFRNLRSHGGGAGKSWI